MSIAIQFDQTSYKKLAKNHFLKKNNQVNQKNIIILIVFVVSRLISSDQWFTQFSAFGQ